MKRAELYSCLKQAASDLAVAERGLVEIVDCARPLVRRQSVTPAVKTPLPHLDRCTEWTVSKNATCRNLANAPFGLCISHFISLFGHSSGGLSAIKFHPGYGERTCRNCGFRWRYATWDASPEDKRKMNIKERSDIRTICPARELSPRAHQILTERAPKNGMESEELDFAGGNASDGIPQGGANTLASSKVEREHASPVSGADQ